MKKILIIIDDEKREIEAEYFDLTISSGIGDGYDAIFAVSTKADGETLIPVEGQVEHPLKNAIMSSSIPKMLTFRDIGLSEALTTQRSIQAVNFSLSLKEGTIVEKASYNVEGYDIRVPDTMHTALVDLVNWEREKSQGRAFCVVSGPTVVFTNDNQTQFKVVENIEIEKGVVTASE